VWAPALKGAGLPHRSIDDMRHTFSAAGMVIFTLVRRMGTSVQMIDRTYAISRRGPKNRSRS
jgi:integrase